MAAEPARVEVHCADTSDQSSQTGPRFALELGTRFQTESRIITTIMRDHFVACAGDNNSLHNNALIARFAGFDEPIAHAQHVQSVAIALINEKGAELLQGSPVIPIQRSNGLKCVNDVKFGEAIHADCVVSQLRPLPGGSFLLRLHVEVWVENIRVQHGQVTFKLVPLPPEADKSH